ncbi:hypothetical protein Tco_1315102 [Tanacetum coccineum]
MSTPAHIDSETISHTDGSRSSRVPIPLPDDPYMEVRQAYLATITNSESEPFKDFRETEIPRPLPIASLPVPSSDDPYLIVGQAYTPAAIDTDSEPEEAPSEPEEAPSETEELQPLATGTTSPSSDHTPTLPDPTVSPLTNEEFKASEPSDTRIALSYSTASSNSTTPLSPDHPPTQTAPTPILSRPLYYCRTARVAVHTQPAMSPGLSARVTEAMTLSPLSFHKRYKSSYETPSSSSLASSLTLPVRKRYRGTSELVEDTETEVEESEAEGTDSKRGDSKDKGPDSERERERTLVKVTTADRPLGLGYGAARRRALDLAEEIAPSTFKTGQSFRSVPDQQVGDKTPTPMIHVRTTWINPKDASLTIPSLVASPVTTPAATIVVDEDEFLEVGAQLELYAIILHDHTQCLDASPPILLEGHGQDITELFDSTRAAGHTDAQREAMWQARFEDHRLIHDLLVQNIAIQHEFQEMKDRVTTLEQERSRREQ